MSEEPATTPPKPNRPEARRRPWVKYLVIALAAVLLLVVVIVVGGYLTFQSYLNSEAFLTMIERETNDALDAEGEFAPLVWNGANVYSPTYRATGKSDALFTRLQADGVRAYLDLNAAWDGVWLVDRLEVNHALIDLTPPARLNAADDTIRNDPEMAGTQLPVPVVETLPDPQEEGETPAAPTPAPAPAETAVENGGGGIFSGMLPEDFQIAEIAVASANLVWSPGEKQEGKLTDASLILRPDDELQQWDVIANGGRITQEGLPELTIQNVNLRVDDSRVHVLEMAMEGPENSRVSTNGTVMLEPESLADLNWEFAGIPLNLVLPEDWQERLSGKLHGEVRMQGSPDEWQKLRLGGNLFIENGMVQKVEVLDKIAWYSRTERFKLLQLTEARTDFVWQEGLLTFENLVMEDRGLLKITGRGTITMPQDGGEPRIDATFQVGIAPGALRWLSGVAEKRVFTESREGYNWTEMRVTGPLDDPDEDLSPRLTAALGEEVAEQVQEIIDDVPDDVKEQGQELLDTAKDVLKGLFR